MDVIIDRLIRLLYWPALLLAWADAVIVPASIFRIPDGLSRIALSASAGFAAIFFCLMLLDRDTRGAIWSANYLIRQRPRGFFGLRLFDPEWGIVGSIWRDRPVMWCNRVLLLELLVSVALLGNSSHPPILTLLAFAGFALTTLMFFLQLKTVVDPNGPKPSAI